MDMKITFPGGLKVNAEYDGFIHKTDQPRESGGESSAPQPFDLFLVSLGTCAGIYVLSFCQKRGIDTSAIELRQSMEFNSQTHLIGQINIEIILPGTFPEKYRAAVVQAAQLCTVKKYLENPPRFNLFTTVR
ncbi:MAG: OsmC family protein [Candidatus Aminicenantes bacterium]|nr:OsmC family protein [Candidatus Aminicenantes bacterium]